MNYDIYFHNDFDGRAAAAVVLAFLRSRGDDIEHFVPVKYDIIPEWIDDNFLAKNKLFRGKHNPAIVVDFPYHPQAVFWFDHHIRPFRNPSWEKKFKPSAGRRYNDKYRSACHLAYDSLRADFDWKPPAHLRELVKWLDVIDFADYKNAKQTIVMKEPAIQINNFIEEYANNLALTTTVIRFLAEKPLNDFIKKPSVKKTISKLKKNTDKALKFYEKNLTIEGNVTIANLTGFRFGELGHYVPYYLYPKKLYAIRFHPHFGKPNLFHINVAANPWLRKQNKKNIGELLRKYGGGGHKDVGGLEIKGEQATIKAVNEVAVFLNGK